MDGMTSSVSLPRSPVGSLTGWPAPNMGRDQGQAANDVDESSSSRCHGPGDVPPSAESCTSRALVCMHAGTSVCGSTCAPHPTPVSAP